MCNYKDRIFTVNEKSVVSDVLFVRDKRETVYNCMKYYFQMARDYLEKLIRSLSEMAEALLIKHDATYCADTPSKRHFSKTFLNVRFQTLLKLNFSDGIVIGQLAISNFELRLFRSLSFLCNC